VPQNYGIAVGDIKAPVGLYRPTTISIDGWDNDYTEVGRRDLFSIHVLHSFLNSFKNVCQIYEDTNIKEPFLAAASLMSSWAGSGAYCWSYLTQSGANC
jgi:hypothetical protein